ncbi:MAG: trehalose-6-phosphate synthase [Actinomycetota bacterium]|jgi:trehalose 6-phosphate synthase|nr:trehalose-6-phosphate synthase [Actinomycetota bacterium]
MPEVVVVSNRGPRSFQLDSSSRPVPADAAGGVAGTLRSLLAGTDTTWIAAAMTPADQMASAAGLMSGDGIRVVAVEPDVELYRMAYDLIANATLWYCHHHLFDLPRRPVLDRRWHEAWEAYRALNVLFAEAVVHAAPPGAVVLVQDYHLALIGSILAKSRPDLRTVHFSHTPFAGPDALRSLPAAAAGELLSGMAGFGACGFHTRRWEHAFRSDYADGVADTGSDPLSPPRTFVAPLGPDSKGLSREMGSPKTVSAQHELDNWVGDRKLIVRVDRVELSKNLLRGFWAYAELLETRPAWRQRVVMMALTYPSRQNLQDYLAYRSEVEHTVARINEQWGTAEWTPIELEVADDRSKSLAALRRYDALLVNPVRDGMNLVAKEGALVNSVGGAVILSREAGAWEELRPAAIGVNPFDVSDTAASMDLALNMPERERSERALKLREIVAQRTAADWLADQLQAAGCAGTE